jgi:hypothetical protein
MIPENITGLLIMAQIRFHGSQDMVVVFIDKEE